MNNKIYKIVAFLGVAFLIASCSDDDHTGLSELDYTRPTVTISSSENNVTVNENAIADSYSITLTASIPQAVTVNLYIPFVQTGGNATAGDDYEVGTITIAAGSTSGTTSVEVYSTGDIEGDESFTLSPGDVINANVSSFSLNVTITDDYVNDVLDMELDWSGEITIEDDYVTQTMDLCALDFDILIFDSAFNDTGIYDGASIRCPEHVGFSDVPDGDYYIVASLYDNPLASFSAGEPFSVTFSWNQDFVGTSGSHVNNDFTTDSAPNDILIAIVNKDGYNYTVTPQ